MEENNIQVTKKSKYWITTLICGILYILLTAFLLYFYFDTRASLATNDSASGGLGIGIGYVLVMVLFCVGGYAACGIVGLICFLITLIAIKKGKCENVWLWINLGVIILSIASMFLFINLPIQ